jgi:hypothetical protein
MKVTFDDEPPPAAEDCLDFHPETCAGAVEYRMALSGTGVPYPRCDKHWSDRLDTEQRLRRDYPDSPCPPSWFDASYAGEHWDSDY